MRALDVDGGSQRGQTTQDFAVGIGIFLLALAFVFVFTPTLLTPYHSSVGGDTVAKTDRAAATIVSNLSVENRPYTLDWEETQRWFDRDDPADALGFQSIDRINVTLQAMDGTVVQNASGAPLQHGPAFTDDRAMESASRIVVVDDASVSDCDPACRLVVRGW